MAIDRWVQTIALRFRSLFRRQQVEDELREELQFYVDQRVEAELVRGVSEQEAQMIALRALGGRDQVTEACRDARGVSLVEDLIQDVSYGARLLRREAGFTAVIVLTLAVGIGANTAVFSVVDGVLLRPVPLLQMDRLVMVWGTDRNSGTLREPVSVPDFLDFEAATTRVRELAAFSGTDLNFAVEGMEPVRAPALRITHNLLPMVGMRPLVGEVFELGDGRHAASRVVLIGEALWARMFARDPGVVGRTVLLNDERHTIIGVIPRDAQFGLASALSAATSARGFADRGGAVDVDLWLPLLVDREAFPRYLHDIFMVGRLGPAVTIADAQRELDAVAAELEQAHTVNHQRGVNVEALSAVVFDPVRLPLLLLLAAVGFVLLVACVNVANLMLARGGTRAREVAMRAALGASRGRLARQFLVESLLLTLTGALVGVLLALAGLELLLALAPAATPRIGTVGIDGRVLAFTLLVSVAAATVFSLIPAGHARPLELQATLRSESAHATAGRDRRRLRRALAVVEVALAVALLLGAGVLLRSFWNLQGTDPGFQAHGTLKAEFQLPRSRYPVEDWPRLTALHAFNDAVLARVAALPGVHSAALARNHPLDAGSTNSFTIIGREEWSLGLPEISIRSVSPDYFETLHVRLLSGRGIEPRDRTGGLPVMVLNEAAARRLFPAGDAIGHRIAVWGAHRSIVGIVSNERILGLATAPPPAAYLPLAQVPPRDGNESLIVRTRVDPAALVGPLRSTFRELDPGLAVFGIEPLTQTVARSIAQRRFTAVLVGAFGAVAILLALIGVHGILRYTVAQRRRDIAIRMAMGADAHRIVRGLMVEGMAVALGGLVLGLALAWALSGLLASLLHDVSPNDSPTLLAVVVLLGSTAWLASWLPARAASRTDPALILREG
jgi:predicted permease